MIAKPVFVQYGRGATFIKNRYHFFNQPHPSTMPHHKVIFQLELVYERP